MSKPAGWTEPIAVSERSWCDFWTGKFDQGSIVLMLPVEIPSLNRLIRAHYRRRRAQQTAFAWALVAAFGETPAETPGFKVRVLIESFRKSLLDEDNLAGGCKLLLDAMRECNFIRDDAPAWLELEVKQWKVQAHAQTRLTISRAGKEL